jgi:hypothetical protein
MLLLIPPAVVGLLPVVGVAAFHPHLAACVSCAGALLLLIIILP